MLENEKKPFNLEPLSRKQCIYIKVIIHILNLKKISFPIVVYENIPNSQVKGIFDYGDYL